MCSNNNSDIIAQRSSQTKAIERTHVYQSNDSTDVENESMEVETETDHVENAPVDDESDDAFHMRVREEAIDRLDDILTKLRKFKKHPAIRPSLHRHFDHMAKGATTSMNAFARTSYDARDGKLIRRRYTSKRIHPNAASIGRRKNGSSRGKTRARRGRPYKNGRCAQAPHGLQRAVTLNRALAKKH